MTLHILLAIFDYYISLNIHHVKKKFIINIERETIKENYRLYIILFFLIDKNPKRVFYPLYVLPKIIYLSQPNIKPSCVIKLIKVM